MLLRKIRGFIQRCIRVFLRRYYYVGNGRALVETQTGFRLFVDLEDFSVTPGIIHTGVWEPHIGKLMKKYLRPGMTYINAGCNVGYHLHRAAQLVGEEGKVFGYEPNPQLVDMLLRSICQNGFTGRTHLYEAAVFDESGVSDFLFCRGHAGGAGLKETEAGFRHGQDSTIIPDRRLAFDSQGEVIQTHADIWGGASVIPVKKVTIDDTAGAYIDQLDMLQMDIERSEGPALLGARKLICRSPNVKIIMEWSAGVEGGALPEDVRSKLTQAVNFLVDEGFKFYLIVPPGRNSYWRSTQLKRVQPGDLFTLGHCDLFITR